MFYKVLIKAQNKKICSKKKKILQIKYANKEGYSTIVAYEIGEDFIKIYFSGSYKYNTYTYTYNSAGEENVENMKKLALEGKGLHSYIMKNVRDKYEKDSRT